ncbi:MAG: hypothetical protein AAGH76_06975 [Pseudomonadota bacterium]
MSTVLASLQRRLEVIYGLDAGPDIGSFLIDAEARFDHADGNRTGAETVFVREADDEVQLAVYIDDDVLERLDRADPFTSLADEGLNDLWLAIEGVSHFRYLTNRAYREFSVTLLELELQAEVDKFVTTWWLAREQGYRGMHAGLWRRLFVDTDFVADLSAEEAERYVVANRYASYYCAALQLFSGASHDSAVADLRQFYRYDQSAKFSEIHRQRLAG